MLAMIESVKEVRESSKITYIYIYKEYIYIHASDLLPYSLSLSFLYWHIRTVANCPSPSASPTIRSFPSWVRDE